MLQKIIDYLIFIDKGITNIILTFLEPYELHTVEKELVYTLPVFIKLTLYLLIFLIPLLVFKFFYPFHKTYNFLLTFIIFLIVMFVFGIFLGFFQLLYS